MMDVWTKSASKILYKDTFKTMTWTHDPLWLRNAFFTLSIKKWCHLKQFNHFSLWNEKSTCPFDPFIRLPLYNVLWKVKSIWLIYLFKPLRVSLCRCFTIQLIQIFYETVGIDFTKTHIQKKEKNDSQLWLFFCLTFR